MAIARAAHFKRSLLILDEPASALAVVEGPEGLRRHREGKPLA
ncbi:hypothetical protein [Streptomyces sp. NPDC001388]